MRSILAWVRLLRPINLLLISFTPVAIWTATIKPLLGHIVLTFEDCLLLGLSIALVAGGGNVINDIADRTIDEFNNRPNPLLEDLHVGVAWITYAILNLGALLCAWQLAGTINKLSYLWLLPCAVSVLASYAFYLKCRPWIGNIVVALFCAGVPGILVLAEPIVLEKLGSSLLSQSFLLYVFFAFFGTWAREMVKDLEDKAGDSAAGCKTLAVIKPSSFVIKAIGVCLFFLLGCIAYLATIWALSAEFVIAFSWAALWGLIATITFQLSPKLATREFTQISRHLKLAMAFGLFLLIFLGVNAWNLPTN